MHRQQNIKFKSNSISYLKWKRLFFPRRITIVFRP